MEAAAQALGWTQAEGTEAVCFTRDEHQVEFSAGQRCRADGVTLRFTDPVLSLNGGLYLSVSDLCSALGLDLQETEEGFVLSA